MTTGLKIRHLKTLKLKKIRGKTQNSRGKVGVRFFDLKLKMTKKFKKELKLKWNKCMHYMYAIIQILSMFLQSAIL